MNALLAVSDLSVSFDGFYALNGVDLTIDEGELRFLIGPNGAGKTTLIDVITGLVRPSTGDVCFAGRSLIGLKEHEIVRAGVGRSFQTPTVFDALTVAENLDLADSFRRRFSALLRRRRGLSDRVTRTIQRIGLDQQADAPAKNLSHGQKQWLEIGMILAQDPRVLLLDEPVAGMTPEERLKTGELLEELSRERTVVVVEHDMAFLRRFARKVTVLHEGRVLSEGSVEDVQSDTRVQQVYLGRSREEAVAELAEVAP